MNLDKKKVSLRFLHCIDSFKTGGTERQCVDLVKGLYRDGYDIFLVTLNKEGPLYNELKSYENRIKEIKISGSFYRPRSILQIFKLSLFMRKIKPQIVQTYGFYSNVPGIIAAKIARVPAIIAGKRDMNEFLSPRRRWIEGFLLRFADAIVVNAREIQNQLINEYKIATEKIVVVSNGVDCEKFRPISLEEKLKLEKLNIGMVANFRRQKDHRTFLEAAVKVLQVKSNVNLILVGSGPYEKEIRDYAKQLGIEEQINFCGKKTGDELASIIKSLFISVLASMNEGLPNVILESMACGVPVIANPSGGVPELIEDGITGYLFPYKRPDILAERIIYLIENKDVAKKMGEEARKKAEKQFNYDLMCKQYEELYEDLLSKKCLLWHKNRVQGRIEIS